MNSNLTIIKQFAAAQAKLFRSFGFRSLLLMLTGMATVMACTWSLITDHSVRFNSFRSGRGFYRLPPLPIMYDRKTGREMAEYELGETGYSEEEDMNDTSYSMSSDTLQPNASEIWEQARASIEQERLSDVHDLLERYLKLTAVPGIEEEKAERQWLRNSAYDMLDALTALKQGSKTTTINEYLDARSAYDKEPTANLEEPLSKSAVDKNLQDNWDYLHAAFLYSKQLKSEALEAFQKHSAKYPLSEKNESVLYMIAKLKMESSYGFEKSGCGVISNETNDKATDLTKVEPAEKCQDENWYEATKDFKQLMQKYPNGRYFNDARGWLAFLYKRGGEPAEALAEYYRLLGNPSDRSWRLEAKKSLQVIGHEYDDETLDKVEELIAGDVNTAMAYSYHRIYNHAIDLTYQEADEWSWYNGDESEHWQKKQQEDARVKDARNAGNHELNRIASFATKMIKRYPKAKVSGGFVLRIAETQLELQDYPEAEKLANRALSLGVKSELRTQALWIKGASEHAAKKFQTARTTFNRLITEFPNDKLTDGARRLLAMTAEDQGDLETALEQYLALKYDYDVAYFVDVLLPTDKLAKFVANHKQNEQYDELLYALGIRYMRDRRWNDARNALRQMRTTSSVQVEDWQAGEDNAVGSFPKEPDWEWNGNQGIKTSWVMQDLKTIDVLEHLEQTVETAQGDEAKAEAMYQLASYQFDANSLLFYNPAAWNGQRYELLFQLDGSDSMRLPNESQTIFEYSQSHETLARAIPIYLDIAERFPQTKAAKDALYSAAVAHERLSDLNPYWRDIYGKGLFAGLQMVTLTDIKRIYPNYQLPRGTNGWEASTRTVNGGPGWEPKPKPAPKLTRTQIFERRAKYVADKFQTLIKPQIDAGTNTVRQSYNTCISWLLRIVCALLFAYVVMLGVHFRTHLLAAAHRLIGPAVKAEQLELEEPPRSESRIEKVIDERES